MKKFLPLLLLGFVLFSCSEKEGNLHITGEIKGLSQGKIYIQRLQDTVLKPIKIIKFDGDSKYDTYINIDEPEVLYMYLDRGVSNSLDNNIAFFAEKGKMTINSDVNNFIAKASVTGNKNQELLNEYRKVISSYNNKNLEYVEKRIEASMKKNQKVVDSITLLEANIFQRKYQYAVNFCVNNKDYEIAPYIAVSEIPDVNPIYLDTIYKSLSEPVLKSRYGKIFSEYLKEIESK